MSDMEFQEPVYRKDGSRVYSKEQIEALKIETAALNVGIEPYKGRGVCGTCGNRGAAHPETSFCFVCGTDNWRNTDF